MDSMVLVHDDVAQVAATPVGTRGYLLLHAFGSQFISVGIWETGRGFPSQDETEDACNELSALLGGATFGLVPFFHGKNKEEVEAFWSSFVQNVGRVYSIFACGGTIYIPRSENYFDSGMGPRIELCTPVQHTQKYQSVRASVDSNRKLHEIGLRFLDDITNI